MLGVVTSEGEWYGAAGTLEAGGGEVVEPNDAFCIHSVTKPITAAVALLAVEQGLLDLDQPLADLLPSDVMDGLHVFEGVDYSDEITVSTNGIAHAAAGLAAGTRNREWNDSGRF